MNEITVVRNNSGGLVLSVSGEALRVLLDILEIATASTVPRFAVAADMLAEIDKARPLAVGDEVIVDLAGGHEFPGKILRIDERGRIDVELENRRIAYRCTFEQVRRSNAQK